MLLGGLLGGGFALAGAASAHATVVSSDPLDGARLKSAPASVSITFDENVGLGSLGYLHVINQQGKRVEQGAAYHPNGDGSKVTVNLPSGLGDGTYTESFRVISADSHPVSGVVRFVIGNGALAAPVLDSSTTTDDSGVSAVFDIARWISYAGLGLLGGAWLLLTVWPEGRDEVRARRLVWIGWGGLVFGAVAELLLEGVFASGRALTESFKPSLVDATLHTSYGTLHCSRLLLLGLLAAVLGWALQPGRQVVAKGQAVWWERAVWPLAVGIAWTFSDSGHATTTNPRWISLSADVLHLLAMATWVGGLAMIAGALLPRGEPDELRRVLPVFSTAAFTSVLVMAVTGTYAAWRGIGSIHAILHTEYGLLVDAKIVGFLGLIALGNLSRVTIQERLRRPRLAYAMTADVLDEPERAGMSANEHELMRRSVLVEVVIAALILVATAVLVSQPRGKEALAADDRHAVSGEASLGSGRTVTINVNPGVHGPVDVTLALHSKTPFPTGTTVTATASEPDQQLGPLPLKLTKAGADVYTASDVNLPVAGQWVFDLAVTTSKFDSTTADVKVRLH